MAGGGYDAYWELIEKCWAEDPGDRPAAVEICTMLEDRRFLLEPEKEAKFRPYVEKLRAVGRPSGGRAKTASGGFTFRRTAQ
jgi:hypothetical protein